MKKRVARLMALSMAAATAEAAAAMTAAVKTAGELPAGTRRSSTGISGRRARIRM